MYLAGLCLTFVMSLGIHGDRLDSLETKIDALVTYIQTDLLLLRENVNDNRKQISKLADLVNTSMIALTRQQYSPSQGITSSEVTPNTDTDHMPDLKLDILQLQSDVERIRRATYEEKRYVRQVYEQLKDAITDLKTSVQSVLHNQVNQETKINELFEHIDTRANLSSHEINEMQTEIKYSIIENQTNLTLETEEKLNRDNKRLDISFNELRATINEWQNEVGFNQTYFYARLSQQHADLITAQSEIDVKFENVSQGFGLLAVSKAECAEIRNQLESAKSSIEAQIKIVKLEVLKVRPTWIYSYDRNTRLNNVTYLNDFRIGGRLEVYHNGEWGTVCNDEFGDTEATVACKEFGYTYGKAQNPDSVSQVYGQGQGEVWLDDLKCTGSESNIHDCPHAEWGVHNCGHHEDIGVTCF